MSEEMDVLPQYEGTVSMVFDVADDQTVTVKYPLDGDEFTLSTSFWTIETIDQVVALLEQAGVPYEAEMDDDDDGEPVEAPSFGPEDVLLKDKDVQPPTPLHWVA